MKQMDLTQLCSTFSKCIPPSCYPSLFALLLGVLLWEAWLGHTKKPAANSSLALLWSLVVFACLLAWELITRKKEKTNDSGKENPAGLSG